MKVDPDNPELARYGGEEPAVKSCFRGIPWRIVGLALIFTFVPVIGSAIPARAVSTSIYRDGTLTKPTWYPPSWLFGPVWIVLYILMGIASFLVWFHGRKEAMHDMIRALVLYGIQLVLNWFWTPIFFSWGYMSAALVEISVLWTMILMCIVLFFPITKVGAGLMLPYLTWVSFATALTYAMVCLNGCYLGDIMTNRTHTNHTEI